MNNIDEKRKKRFQFLKALYDQTDGDQLESINYLTLGEGIGFTSDDANKVSDYLDAEGLIKYVAGGFVSITHKGVIEIENAIAQPESQTKYFPPVNLIVVGDVINSNIQQGNNNTVQTNNYFSPEKEAAIFELLGEIRNNISKLGLKEDKYKETEVEVKTIEIQLTSPKPKQIIIREFFNSLKSIFEEVAESAIVNLLLKRIADLL